MTLTPGPWVWLARIRRPQGRKGEVFAELLTDFPEKFADRRRLWLLAPDVSSSSPAGAPRRGSPATGPRRGQSAGAPGPSLLGTGEAKPDLPETRQVELANHWLHKGGIVLHFAGVDSISAAESLAGLIVAIPRAERAALPEDEVYIADLIGCELFNVSGSVPALVGTIDDVDRGAGPTPLLIVRSPAGEVLIPFAQSYLPKIDVAAKRVEMALPEGLVDLNVAGEP